MGQPQPRQNCIALTFILNKETVQVAPIECSKSSGELVRPTIEENCRYSKKNNSRVRKRSLLTLRQAASLTGLNRLSSYEHLLNESEESLVAAFREEDETSSLCSQKRILNQEPFCIFNSSSDSAKLCFPQSSQDKENEVEDNLSQETCSMESHSKQDIQNLEEDERPLFAKAVKSSLRCEPEVQSGVELRQTSYAELSRPYDIMSVLVVGGMEEGQVSWKKEMFSLWQVKVIKKNCYSSDISSEN